MANIHRISLQFVTKDGVRLQPVTFEVRDGDKGDQGIPGKTAYEVWLEMPGNAGKTKEQYQEFLKADITISQSTGTSTTAVMSQKATTDGLNGRVPVGRQINGKPLTSDVNLVAGDVNAYTKTEIDSKVSVINKATSDNATAISNTTKDLQDYKVTVNENFVPKTRKVNGKGLSTDITLTPADIGSPTSAEFTTGLATKVPTTRKINGKPLTADVTLVAGDVGTYSKSEIDLKMDGAAITIEQTTGSGTDTLMSQKATTDALNGKVPTTRKINGKALTTDISLTHTDVGAVGKNEAANDSLRLGGATPATGGTANTVAVRNSSGELSAKSLVTTVAVNTTPTAGSEFAIRQSANKAMEFVTPAKAADLLGVVGNDTFQQSLAGKVDKTTKVNGKVLSGDVTLVPGDVNTYSKAEIDQKVSASTVSVLQVTGSSTAGVMSQKATTDAIGGRVPTSRKVNNKALTADITLTPADVGVYDNTEVDTKLATKVPTARKINGKALTADITLAAVDVNAYTKAEVDSRVGNLVPTTRKVNGKALTADITLSAADVGALAVGTPAPTANKLTTARTINGTNFDGSTNITTANWGTARNIAIGNSSKSVNGAGNVSYTLDEIGAEAKLTAEQKRSIFSGEGAPDPALGSVGDIYIQY